SGFRATALLLVRCARNWCPHEFPPTVGYPDDVRPDDVRIAYRVLAERIAGVTLAGLDAEACRDGDGKKPRATKPKASTHSGDAEASVSAALTAHHQVA